MERSVPWQGVPGRFELHGLDPDVETPVYFVNHERRLGAVMNLSGKSVALIMIENRPGRVALGASNAFPDKSKVRGPISVRLESFGAAKARFVDPDGEPVAAHIPRDVRITMVVTDGLPYGKALGNSGVLFADEAGLNQVDPINYPNELVSDPSGRLALPALIPGATYRFIDHSTGLNAVPQVRKEFKVEPGQTVDLGDILIEKPPE